MIILLGFPKSGTTSFNKLFESLGLNSYHWKKNGQFIGLLIKKNKEQGWKAELGEPHFLFMHIAHWPAFRLLRLQCNRNKK